MLDWLLNDGFFPSLPEYALWLIAVGAIAILVFGADRLVGAAARLAATVGLSKIIIGATVVSLGTTSPEAAVSVRAAIGGDPGLALGNGVGSIICNMALIFGLACLIKRLPKDRFVLNRHGYLQLGAGALLFGVAAVLWLLAGDISKVTIPRGVGVAFVLLLVGYLYVSVRWARRHPEIIPLEAEVTLARNHQIRRAAWSLLVLLFGLALVVAGSELLVGSAKDICRRYEVPQAVLAVTLVAFGTSLPELVTAIASIVKGHAEILVGNVVGANILNVLFVVGVSATAVPLRVDPIFFYLLLPVMMAVLLLFRVFVSINGAKFHRWQGVVLLAVYVGFVTVLVTIFGIGR